MSQRYFVETPITADRAVLSGPEAHHLIHVMRLPAGATVTLFDGSGCEFAARIEHVRHAEVELGILARAEVDRELPRRLVLGVALPKGDRQKWLVEKAVELGLGRLVPLETARSVARPTGQALARLRRTVIEASKQCGRNRLLEIALPQCWAEFVAAADGNSLRLFAHPHADKKSTGLRASGAGGVMLAVGPEGGFTDEEAAQAVAAGWQQVDLGPRILRVETAALALVAWVAGF
ncbi:MAG: 16S rRNA (uracil(1498)-N(3))-methyltransferase [Thermoguttaceae bacterium]